MDYLFGTNDNGLSDLYIENVLENTCVLFNGCFSCDNISENICSLKYASLIVNLSNSYESGTHFITIILKPQHVIYLDSFGKPCQNDLIYEFMRKCNRPIIMNDLCIQHVLSNYCGFFCMALCLYHDSERDFYLNYSNNLIENDVLSVLYVIDMINEYRM